MNGALIPPEALASAQRGAMYAIFRSQFPDTPREAFDRDLDAKNWVLLLEDERTGAPAGFSTMLHSGDTVVSESAAGSPSLSKCWIGAVNRLRGDDPAPLFWLLIVSGFRTYRFLPVYWRRFYPRYDEPTPPETQALMETLAAERFGSRYDRDKGIVRLETPEILRPELREIPEHRLADPHVAYFASRNPGYRRGDEMVCIAELSIDNTTPAGRRMWEAGRTALLPAGSHA
jgi:hypothetical protein